MSGVLPQLVLAIYPSSRGFGFVFFEGPSSPFYWGIKEIKARHKNMRAIAAIKKLVDRYRPEVIVIEETAGRNPRRGSRIRKLYRMIMHLAAAEYIDVYRCSRTEVKACFASVGASTHHEIAKALSTQMPAFAELVPRVRRGWMSEQPRESLFNAAALGIAYFSRGVPSLYQDDLDA